MLLTSPLTPHSRLHRSTLDVKLGHEQTVSFLHGIAQASRRKGGAHEDLDVVLPRCLQLLMHHDREVRMCAVEALALCGKANVLLHSGAAMPSRRAPPKKHRWDAHDSTPGSPQAMRRSSPPNRRDVGGASTKRSMVSSTFGTTADAHMGWSATRGPHGTSGIGSPRGGQLKADEGRVRAVLGAESASAGAAAWGRADVDEAQGAGERRAGSEVDLLEELNMSVPESSRSLVDALMRITDDARAHFLLVAHNL